MLTRILILLTHPADPDPAGLMKTPADQQDPNYDPDPYLDPGLQLLLIKILIKIKILVLFRIKMLFQDLCCLAHYIY